MSVTAEYVCSRIDYNPETGALIWKPIVEQSSIDKMWNTRFAGKKITHKNSSGHIQFGMNGKNYLAHRMAWLIVHGDLPDLIDHANGVRDDNRLCNLRPATRSQNSSNTRRRSDNTSGYRGVSHRCHPIKWSAFIGVNGKTLHLGNFDRPEDAAHAYDAAAKKYHGEFATLNFRR